MKTSPGGPPRLGQARSGRSVESRSLTISVVPTGQVDSTISKSPAFNTGATERTADRT